MKNIIAGFVIGSMLGIGCTALTTQSLIAQNSTEKSETYKQLDLFGEVFERIKRNYVEDVTSEELISNAINGMLQGLDPHSGYLPPEAFEDISDQTKGEFGGLGIEITQENGFVKIVSPIDGTPAFEAGVQAGDIITHIDGSSAQGLSIDEAVDRLRGEIGSEITITVFREENEESLDISIIRDSIKLTAVRGRIEDNSVILRISTFNRQTFPNLKKELSENVAELGGIEKVDGFIIDLRFNPGGLLDVAIDVSDAFLDKGEIVSIRGRDANDSDRYNARKGDLTDGKPIVVLINGGSASASEIVAGALQDHHRAVIVGTRSFGKGSVQSIINLGENRAMRMTTARYYTPSGRSIQALGVQPDIIVPQILPENDGEEVNTNLRSEQDLSGSLDNDSLTEDEIKQLDEERTAQEDAARIRTEDNQMAYALDLIKGLSVLERN